MIRTEHDVRVPPEPGSLEGVEDGADLRVDVAHHRVVRATRGANVIGGDRVAVAANLVDAIDQATTLAEAGGVFGEGLGSGGVLVTGSVITVGEARALINPKEL